MPAPTSLLQSVLGDVRFALRHFARHKGTTAIIVAVLALGTGANTLIFSLFQAEFLRPAPAVPADASHMRIWSEERTSPTASPAPREFTSLELKAIAEHHDIFRSVAAWAEDVVILGGDSTGARSINAQFITPNYFTTLGVPIVAGRGLVEGPDEVADNTAVMSHLVAEELYGSAAAAIGHTVLVNEIAVTVVGVAPPRFQGALKNMDEPELWMPLSARSGITGLPYRWLVENSSLALFASLDPAASPEQATAIARQVVNRFLPDSGSRVGMTRTADVQALYAPPPGQRGTEVVFAFTIVFSLGVLILFVACMNVSSLMVAAAVARRHEIAVRLALGASRLRLIRQLVTESTILSLIGGSAGLLMAWWTLTWMAKTEIDGVDIAPDLGTFAFVLLMAVATGILFGLSPALNATRGGVANAMRDSGGGSSHRSRLQRGLVVAQIAASQPLLLLLGVMLSLVIADYRPLAETMSREVILARFDPLDDAKSATLGAQAVHGLIPRIAERPEIRAVVPAASAFDVRGVFALDETGRHAPSDSVPTVAHLEGVAPGWFELLDVPILLGRDVTLADTLSSDRPVVIGADMARKLWGDVNPIGRRLTSPVLEGLVQDSIAMTVVGVYDATQTVPGMTFQGENTTTNVNFRVYTAHGKHWDPEQVLIRTRGPAAVHLNGLQRFAIDAAPSLPLLDMRTLTQIDENEYLVTVKVSMLAGAGGMLALLLASLGLYGVVSLSVRQRTREIGIRIAVGANPIRVAVMFLLSGVRSSVIALAIGLPLSVAALKLGMSSGDFIAPGVNPYLVGAVIALLLIAVAAAATWIPARRAALVDPATALRTE